MIVTSFLRRLPCKTRSPKPVGAGPIGILEPRRPRLDRAQDPRYSFDADPTLDEIIAQQGKGPVTDLSVLHGDFWPEEESVEEFLEALHEWRGHKRADPAA